MDLDSTYGALTILYDELSEEDTEPSCMQDFLSDSFPEDQYLYRNVKTVPDENELIADLRESNDNLDIRFPVAMRFVFCYYLELKNLTEEKVNEFFRRADAFSALQPAGTPTDQHYVICFRYQVHMLSAEEKNRVCPLLIRLMTKDPIVSREIYLFPAKALQTFESQEKGLARLLYQESRMNRKLAGKEWLKTITYDDFYADRVKRCNAELALIASYLNDEADPDLKALKAKADEIYKEARNDYRASLRNFRARMSLFPVNVEDFEGGLFKTSRSTIGFRDRRLQKARANYMEEREKQILRKIHMEALTDVVKDYHDPDLGALSDFLGSDDGKRTFLSSDITQSADEEGEQRFRNDVTEMFWQELKKILEGKNRERIREEKIARQKRFQKERLKAGVYQSLADCCRNIEQRTQFKGLQGILGQIEAQQVWVSPACAAAITAHKLPAIQNLPDPVTVPEIAPQQIVVFRVYELLNLTQESAAAKLSSLLT